MERELSDRITVAINGAGGRMGQRLVALTQADDDLRLVAALESPTSPLLGQDVGELSGIGRVGVKAETELRAHPDVLIDFSTPEGAVHIARICADRKIALVEATTGLNEQQRAVIHEAAHVTAVVMSPSMSLAVNVAMSLVRDAARALRNLPSGVDLEIIERHHRFKEDAPSGTALKFGQIASDIMGQTEHVHGRRGQTGPRPRTQIGYHALRTGDNVGEHQIVFGMMGETLEISVRGHTRDSYAHGALAAAKFAAGQPAGLYSMADVLGI